MSQRSGRTRTLGAGLALAGLLLGLAPAARAENGDGRRTMRRLPANLGRGIVGVFHGDNLIPFLVGGSAGATAS